MIVDSLMVSAIERSDGATSRIYMCDVYRVLWYDASMPPGTYDAWKACDTPGPPRGVSRRLEPAERADP